MNKINFENNSEPDITAENLNQLQTNIDNAKVEKVSGKGLSTNDFTNDYKNKVDSSLFFNVIGQLANVMYWRVGKLNRWFGSLVTINIFCDGGYVMTVHLNVGYVDGQGVVLEKIGSTSVYSKKPFTKVRLTYKDNDCYLEMYNPQKLTNVKCAITIHSAKNNMCDFTSMNEVGSIPSGYSTKEIEI